MVTANETPMRNVPESALPPAQRLPGLGAMVLRSLGRAGTEKGCPRGQTRAARGRQTDQPSGICLWPHFNSWMEGCQVTQCEKVLRHLRKFGSITPMEAIQEYGIMRLGPGAGI